MSVEQVLHLGPVSGRLTAAPTNTTKRPSQAGRVIQRLSPRSPGIAGGGEAVGSGTVGSGCGGWLGEVATSDGGKGNVVDGSRPGGVADPPSDRPISAALIVAAAPISATVIITTPRDSAMAILLGPDWSTLWELVSW
jgi:hypothetical protein